MSDNIKTIWFIDSDYKELFRIPDGGNIKIIYPPDDDRGTITRQCKYLDECHTRVGNYDYHICEFAERMEAIGARYEPEVQVQNAELILFVKGEEKYYTFNREEGNLCIGHISGDFGSDGERFFSIWSDRENDRNTPEFQTELHSAVYSLRQSLLKNYDSMSAYCENHPESLLDSGDTYKRYGFELETNDRQYYTQCFLGENMRDARFVVYAYDKAAPVREQAQSVNTPNAELSVGKILPGTADENKMFYRNDEDGNLCVGHLRGDFGKQGSEFWHSWFDRDVSKNTPEFKDEFQEIMGILRQDVLKDYKSSAAYCYKHPEAKLPDSDGNYYGFKAETKNHKFYIRCTTLRSDYFYVFAYNKAVHALEQEQFDGDNQSVLKKIREAEKAPKPPHKNKTPDKQKDDAEL